MGAGGRLSANPGVFLVVVLRIAKDKRAQISR